MATSLLHNRVPDAWRRASYPSTKPLAAWVRDFRARVDALHTWLVRGQPPAFWLPGLFFPQGFVTAVLQIHARRTRLPIDRLALGFRVLPPAADEALMARVAAATGGAIAAAIAVAGSRGVSATPAHAGVVDGGEEGEGGAGDEGAGGGGGGGALGGSGWGGGPAEGGVLVYGLFLEGGRWDGGK
ncbi:Dynein heavy chain 6, axonemal, partial [Tetrabaena socialis]